MASSKPQDRIVVVGAGMGGLAAALRLATAGRQVLVVEASDAPGGKLREVSAGGRRFDTGPTVLTMKWVFDDLLAGCGSSLDNELALEKADVLARHYWSGGGALDLYADPARTFEAVEAFAGRREADGYRRFAADSSRVHALLKDTFIDATRPNPVSLSRRIGLSKAGALFALRPFSTLWAALDDYFTDQRLKRLFARYATYCGSSPYLAPATLMLIAHVEQEGVWIAKHGMHALAQRFAALAVGLGADFRNGTPVDAILADASGRRVTGVRLADGEVVPASQVIFNGDVAALSGLLASGKSRRQRAAPGSRSQSALVVCGLARTEGVPLAHHTVFFSDDYEAEFKAVFEHRTPPADPTVYVCAQDRDSAGALPPGVSVGAAERIYCLMNLPADGDRRTYTKSELEKCLAAMDRRLSANGLTLGRDGGAQVLTAPDTFHRLYPATGGALYGEVTHGWMASFRRPAARGPLKGLYLAGGSVHPGAGLPMAALSGKIAADCLMADLGLGGPNSIGRFHPVAIAGGT